MSTNNSLKPNTASNYLQTLMEYDAGNIVRGYSKLAQSDRNNPGRVAEVLRNAANLEQHLFFKRERLGECEVLDNTITKNLPISTQHLLIIRTSLLTEKLKEQQNLRRDYKETCNSINYAKQGVYGENGIDSDRLDKLIEKKTKLADQLQANATTVNNATLEVDSLLKAIEMRSVLNNTK